ncbi:MAG: DUF1501 domain-containing protein [Gemmataceae bacterium]|nr:DUF1501 domain-containing protein [Gemmataceae bacterium]
MKTKISRRQMLQIGGVGMLGLTLPRMLQASAPRNGQKSCIFIVQYGGASHHDSWDLKPDASDDIRGPYRPIATNVPGIQVGELFPKLASMADRYTIIRSMTHGNGGHDGGMHICMTGHSAPTVETPYFGSVVAKVRPSTANMPSYVWLQNLAGDVQPRYLNGGFLGASYSPLRVGNDMDNPAEPNFRVRAFDTHADVSHERMRQRLQLISQLPSPSGRGAGGEGASQASMQMFQERAVDLLTGPEARRAFDLDHETRGTRDRYGRHALGQNLLMARRLIESGVRLVSVTAWAGLPRGETFRNVQTWDMHGNGAGLGSIFGNGAFGLGWALPNVDQGVSALLEDLHVRGILDDTLVVMVGEFGRTPRISNAGRDHWPACYSAMLAGAGIRGGYVHGSSDRQGAYVRDAAVRPEAFGATLFHALGIPPETRLSPDGFTRSASAGQPVLNLFA